MADVVAEYMLAQNRPLNAQNVADALGRHGIKKGLAQKYLDTLSERGTIAVKEAGKSKVYFAPQTASVMTPEEVAEAECAIKRRTEELANSRAEAARKRARLSAYATQLTVKQMKARTTQLATENGDLETKLAPLRASKGAEISPAEMKKAEDAFVNLVELWGKRKRGFNDVFEVIVDSMAGGVKGAKKKLLDDLGIDVDSDAQSASLQEYRKLVDGIKKKRAMEARMKKYKRNTAA